MDVGVAGERACKLNRFTLRSLKGQVHISM